MRTQELHGTAKAGKRSLLASAVAAVCICLVHGAGLAQEPKAPRGPAGEPQRGCIVAGQVTSPATHPGCSPDLLPEVLENPPAPRPEPIALSELPLPPTAPSEAAGSCTAAVNPRQTGCIAAHDNGIFEGPSYMWDGRHVLVPIEFAGAPDAPHPSSVFRGQQVIAVRTDGTRFPNGDAWKCLTCGVPAENSKHAYRSREPGAGLIQPRGAPGAETGPENILVDHPQAFRNGRRILAGTNIIDCGPYPLVDVRCTPERVRIYPIHWTMTTDGSGPGGAMRELRLNPDDVHLGWSHMTGGTQFSLIGRLVFNPSPKAGTPMGPRYELEQVRFLNDKSGAFFSVDPNDPGRLVHNHPRYAVGEFRGFSGDGKWALGVYHEESGNTDLYKTSLASGESIRITRDPGYTDPMDSSPDDKWNVVLNTQDERHLWYAGLRGIPPLTDLLTGAVMYYGFRNANFRYFQPILLDQYGERGRYRGQRLNAGPGTPANFSDPNWNARADPTWSPNGTNVVFWQALLSEPGCGGADQASCPISTAQGGRRTRLMMARLTSRKPLRVRPVPPVPDAMPWATRYRPGDKLPSRLPAAPAGKFTLAGKVAGSADVEIRHGANGRVNFVSAVYRGFSDDGFHVIDGNESAEGVGSGMGPPSVVWHADIRASGLQNGTKVTSPGGFRPGGIGRAAQGSLTTTINGKVFTTPTAGN